ncbi:MAG: DUF927 domain-containing protein [Hyphomicrobiales bacterium]
MTTTSNFAKSNHLWRFAECVDNEGKTAKLVIHHLTRGKLAPHPLILELSECQRPKVVMDKLLDRGADIDPDIDDKLLAKKIKRNGLHNGIYFSKAGLHDDFFIANGKAYGNIPANWVLDPCLIEHLAKQYEQKGELEDWLEYVAELAEKSDFVMFSIMMAFAAPLQGIVFQEVSEGALFNLAGGSSRGKTTAMMAAQSVMGKGSKLAVFDQTPRRLAEHAAASSDTLILYDDSDRANSNRSFAKGFVEMTHMLTSGQAKQYSGAVKEQFPDLKWSFMALIGSRETIEALSSEHGHQREDHERVRAIDLIVPVPEEGGIWTDIDDDNDPRALSDELKVNSSEFYGTAFPEWLHHIVGNTDVGKSAKELVDWYILEFGIAKNDHLGHRVGKKFGLIFAAGILAMEHELLPWDRKNIMVATTRMHRNALQTLHSKQTLVEKGLDQLRMLANEHIADDEILSGKLHFEKGAVPRVFIKKTRNSRYLYLTKYRLQQLFPTIASETAGLAKLEEIGAYRRPRGKATTVQTEVWVGSKKQKLRFLMLDVDALLDSGDDVGTKTSKAL